MGNKVGVKRIVDRFEPTRLIVKVAQIVVHEADEPDVLVGLLDPHLLSRKDLADVDLAALVTDAAARGDDGCPVVQWVGD